jgi:signal transduction histidine kinase
VRLSTFLRDNSEEILLSWDEFAATVAHGGQDLDWHALRDHAAQILKTIADDLDEPQSDAEQVAKSRGEQERAEGDADTAAETHADTRIGAGFAIDAMITEYRALRASVLRKWAASKHGCEPSDELKQLTRFNEAIDQALTESVARYTAQVRQFTNLFLGMLGHDIRNPLGAIAMATHLLIRRGQVTAQAAEPIVNGVSRIQEIVDLIVDFTRAQTDGAMPVHLLPGRLDDVLRNVVAETQMRHPSVPVNLLVENDTQGEWDPARVSQLLSNLLENAMTYGKADRPVTVRVAGNPDQVTITIHNEGHAIAAAEQALIFEPRHRGASARQRAPQGMGLGLYICREIVKAHAGTLSLRSVEGEGTTFTVALPRRPGSAPAPVHEKPGQGEPT